MKHRFLARKGVLLGATLAALGALLSLAPASQAQFGISERQEVEAGQQVMRQAIREFGQPVASNDPRQRRVSAIAARLTPHVRRTSIPYSFTTLNNDRILNAFAAPGGPVMVTTRLIHDVDNDAELALVIAHEIAHIEEKHAVNQAQRQTQLGLGIGILGAILGRGGSTDLVGTVAGVGVGLLNSGYSRSQEREADEGGVRLMTQAGFDPNAAITMLGKLGSNRSGLSRYLATHPAPAERQGRVRELIQRENLRAAAQRAGGGRAILNLSGAQSVSTAPTWRGDQFPASADEPQFIQLRTVQGGQFRVVLAPVAPINDFAGGQLSFSGSQVTVRRNRSSVTFVNGSTAATLNGRRVTMSAPAQIIEGRFFAPLGTLAQGLDGSATYDANRRLIRLDFGSGRTADLAFAG